MQNNFLSGTLPFDEALQSFSSISSSSWTNKLEVLRLDNNELSGTISSRIGQFQSLSILSMTENFFSGTLPPELKELSLLESAKFQNNLLHGIVPNGLCDGSISSNVEGDVGEGQLSLLPHLRELESDCLNNDLDCSCCTLCCSTKNKKCQVQFH